MQAQKGERMNQRKQVVTNEIGIEAKEVSKNELKTE